MSLRTRLLIGYGYLVLLVLAVAGTATIGFFDLGGRIQRVLNQNMESLEQTTHLLEALERQDSATLSALLRGSPKGADVEESDAAFRKALSASKTAATDDEERTVIRRLERAYQTYETARSKLLQGTHREPLKAYQKQVFPKFKAVKRNVQELLEDNQEAVAEAERRAQQRSHRYGVAMAALVGFGLLSFLVLTRALQRRLLDRLAEIEDVADAVASGDMNRRVSVDHNDELGAVGRQFNLALDRYVELERHVEGRLAEMKQNILGMFDGFDVEGAFFNLDGSLVVATAELEERLATPDTREVIVDAGRRLVEAHHEAEETGPRKTTVELDDGATIDVELLYARGHRLVGWLARFAEGSGA